MKKLIAAAILAATFSGAILTGCSDEREVTGGEGLLNLKAVFKSDVKVNSRATTAEELSEKTIVWISNPKGVVRKYNGLNNVPVGGIPLLSDHYVAEVWAGDSVSASFDSKWYKGREEFDITNGNTTNVNINCRVANTVASVVYGEKVLEMLSEPVLTVGHKRGELDFEGADERKGYFMMPSTDKDLKWNLKGNLANGTIYTRAGVIENVKPATEYIIHIDYNTSGTTDPEGAGYFTITIDERAIEVAEDIEIAMAPQFKGSNFELSEPVLGEVGKFEQKSILAFANGNLTGFVIESSILQSIVGGEDVDLFAESMSETVAQKLKDGGINYVYNYDADANTSVMKLNMESTLLNSLTEGDYTIKFTATDSQGKSNTATLAITATDAPVMSDDVVSTDVWATSATLSVRVLKDDAVNPGLRYRKKGDTTWTAAAISRSRAKGDTYTVRLTGLEPGTTYEYTATAQDYTSKSVKEFTTEGATQLPNAGFENWQLSTPYLIYGSGEEMFWDSGNHGSKTMGKNVTVPNSDIKHSGNYSIELASQFVGVGLAGKFAAGNVFIGKYLETQGTNGVLGWGRPWTSRPTALKGYMKYTPATITHTSVSGVNKGDMDTAIMYIAILDNTYPLAGSDTYGSEYPFVCRTKEKQFFDKTASNVLGYGELIIDKATEGDGMVEFTINITYTRTNTKAANILFVGSASRYGDYFTGGDGSKLLLDDLQLVY